MRLPKAAEDHCLRILGCTSEDLAAEFDPRLADVWLSVFELWPAGAAVPEQLSSLLRMAYVQGYGDALLEEQRGSLFQNLGLTPPPPPARRPSGRREGARA